MKLFTTKQIAEIDRYTIENEPITDIDLMERAARQMYYQLSAELLTSHPILFFAGPGNNGGDALALARMYASDGVECSVFLLDNGKPLSGSPAINWQRLKNQAIANLQIIKSIEDFPVLKTDDAIIDGLFGSGLSRPLTGLPAALVNHINKSGCQVFSIDIPSGLMGEDNIENNPENIIRATTTLTLQFPKLSLLFPENEEFTGNVEVVDIGLHPRGIELTDTPWFMAERKHIRKLIPARSKYAHKGTYGHALLMAGSKGKMGAAILASHASMRSGVGLLTVHVPGNGYSIMQTSVPEAMCSVDNNNNIISILPELDKFSAIGIGPGLGNCSETKEAIRQLLQNIKVPLVADADALNIISENRALLNMLPGKTILTPHPGEFKRLFGETTNSWQRLHIMRETAQRLGIIIVLKGAYTAIALPSGKVYFNPTGNPGMATGGSGDVLTGTILSFLAQGIPPEHAAIAGVYLHGLAGDLATSEISPEALIASDIPKYIGKAFREINDTWQQEF
jgi:ADP-dependent NAD(P)H-hydrate dehydratase / NAD(P)H-hydrate epimerase